MQILHIAGYKFVALLDVEALRETLLNLLLPLACKGTILLSQEGININLAGEISAIRHFIDFLQADERFKDIPFHETETNKLPYRFVKVKIKPEIISLHQPHIDVEGHRAPAITPQEFKQWLDEKRDITVLDTRNDYEVSFGTFTDAINLKLDDFSHLPTVIDKIPTDKTIVMFCTGGIRCEKAAVYLLTHGYSQVYQLEGGILGYFKQVGGDHYTGDCFVFDERVALDSNLQATANIQCKICHAPVSALDQQSTKYIAAFACPACSAD